MSISEKGEEKLLMEKKECDGKFIKAFIRIFIFGHILRCGKKLINFNIRKVRH